MAEPFTIATHTIAEWNGRVPIMLGVTGHRDIDVTSKTLRRTIREQCRELKKTCPNTPFIILSGMAEGADRLVATIAMEELNATLFAVLPMPREEFEKDFETEESKADFRALLARAFCVMIAPHTADDGDAWKTQGEARNHRYASAGAIIADHAQVLFALWDSGPSRGMGGTADVVAWFRRGYAPPRYSLYAEALSPLDPPEPGRLIVIKPSTGVVTFFEDHGDENHKVNRRSEAGAILRFTERYNADVVAYPDAIARSRKAPLVPPGRIKGMAANFIDNAYCASDGLAIRYAHLVRLADIFIYTLAMLAFFTFNFLSLWPMASWVYLGITLAMAALGGGIWWYRTDNRFVEYRSLAEAMRVMYFWRVAGLSKTLWLSYLSRHSGVVHWIRHAVRTLEFCKICLVPHPDRHETADRTECLALMREHWIDSQITFFTKKREEHFRHYNDWIWRARIAILLSFVAALALAVAVAAGFYDAGNIWNWRQDISKFEVSMQVILGTFAAIGLTVQGFLARRADLELTKTYTAQCKIFTTARHTLETCARMPDADWTVEQILEQLGREALQEQAEWLWLRHSRPFEVPT